MKNSIRIASALLALTALLLPSSCGTQKKVKELTTKKVAVNLTLPKEKEMAFDDLSISRAQDSALIINDPITGKEVTLMKAIRDSLTGEMVATETIEASIVVARFRNVAERHGMVDIEFEIQVPKIMLDPAWQLRIQPTMYVLGDTTVLDKVLVTGSDFRKNQLRGYERYDRFLRSIVADSTKFINLDLLSVFIERNIPDLYAFRQDSSIVTAQQFQSVYGVTEQQAVEHYTNKIARWMNNQRKGARAKMYARYIKCPVPDKGIRIDSLLLSIPETFKYDYIETIATRPALRKVEVVLEGGIWDDANHELYHIDRCEPLTFYISSLTSFVDSRTRYLEKIIERHAEANDTYEIIFPVNGTELIPGVGNNASEIAAIKTRLSQLMNNEEFMLDSIVVTASASPDGSWGINDKLSRQRSQSTCSYFNRYMKTYQDSVERAIRKARESSVVINLDETYNEKEVYQRVKIPFIAKSVPENWPLLDYFVDNDTVMTAAQKRYYYSCEKKASGADEREALLRKDPALYGYLKGTYYDILRNMTFNFNLHRKWMTQERVTTTIVDERYMNALQMLKDRRFEEALDVLVDYQDYNTAVAYSLLDRNASALQILEQQEKTAEVNYMLAIIASRQGRIKDAVQYYVTACSQNSVYKHRGNLDPEIAPLIKAYGLNKEEEEPIAY